MVGSWSGLGQFGSVHGRVGSVSFMVGLVQFGSVHGRFGSVWVLGRVSVWVGSWSGWVGSW